MGYLILDAESYSLDQLMAPAPPPAAVLGKVKDLKWAGRFAAEVMAKSAAGAPLPTGPTAAAVLVRPEAAGPSPRQVMIYRREWQGCKYRTGRHRYLCGNWQECQNPEGPWTFYQSPGHIGGRTEPQYCRQCRHRHPTQRIREGMARVNRRRATRRK